VYRRINVTLPEETLKLMDRVSPRGQRSRLIHVAVRRYVLEMRRKKLRKRLKEGYLRAASDDRHLAEDWSLLDEDAWPPRSI